MQLHTSAGAHVWNPTSQEIARKLGELPVNPDYDAVLAGSQGALIRASGQIREYWAGGASAGLILHALDDRARIFESVTRHPSARVIRVFQLYAQGSPQWKQEIEWNEFTPGRTFLIAALLVAHFIILLWLD